MTPSPRRRRDRRLSAKPVPSDRRKNDRRLDEERRSAARVPIDLWMEEVHGDEVYFRRSCNISEGGVFFDQSVPHPVQTSITLRFRLPGTAQDIVAHGEVVSAARSKEGTGMGVKFIDISPDHKTALSKFIQHMQEKRGHL